jgi:hypothetical protein
LDTFSEELWVSLSRDRAERLIELEQILACSRTTTALSREGDAEPATVHLAGVPDERIQRLTGELRACSDIDHDEIAAITARLLLNDYGTAVGHLRAVARLAVARIDEAAATINDCQESIRREQKLDLKRSGAAAE